MQYHKDIIKNLTEQLIKAKNSEEEIIINDKLKMEQEFIDNLYNILYTYKTNTEDNILNNKIKNNNSEFENNSPRINKQTVKDKIIKKEKNKPVYLLHIYYKYLVFHE